MSVPNQAERPVPSSQWMSGLSEADRNTLKERVLLVQSWIDGFAKALGKRRPPKARIAETFTYYAPWANIVAVPARTLLDLDERLLRIVVAHQCGRFNRRWASLLSRSDVARLGEGILADRMAMRLTGASLDDLDAAVRAIAKCEDGWECADADEYIALRRKLLRLTA